MITFPLTFVISDTVNEYYGPRATKRIVYIGLWMSVLVYGVVNIAQALPYLNRPFNGEILIEINTRICKCHSNQIYQSK